MEEIWQRGFDFIQYAQQFEYPVLNQIFIIFTFLGTEIFYLILFALLLWSLHFKLGVKVRWLYIISIYINALLKLIFQMESPFDFIPELQFNPIAGYEFPCCTAQSAILVWSSIAHGLKNRFLWYVAIFLSLLIGVSKIYLGSNFPQGVAAGWLIGFFIFYVYYFFLEPRLGSISKLINPLKSKIFFATLFTILSISFLINDETIIAIGALVGMVWGFTLNSHFIFFQDAGGSLKDRLIRFVIGITGIIMIYSGLQLIFPETGYIYSNFCQFARYMLLGLWISAGAPWIFSRLSLMGDYCSEKGAAIKDYLAAMIRGYSVILMLIMLSFSLTATAANVYIIKDREGNMVRITNQHQIQKQEKDAGCTITILIEDQKEKKQVSQFKYNFKEKIDWVKARTAAQIIERTIKNGTLHELNYPVYQVLATAYTPDARCCAPFDDGFTATGYPAGYGSIAIDPDYGQFRYGDVLYVEGYGLGVADDCGSAIKGNHIDVCFNLGELQRADNWGRKYVRVWKIS